MLRSKRFVMAGIFAATSLTISNGCSPAEDDASTGGGAELAVPVASPSGTPQPSSTPSTETAAVELPDWATVKPAGTPPAAPQPAAWPGVGNNLLNNSDFEAGSSRPFAWWIEDLNPEGVSVSVESAAPFEGGRSVKMELPSNVTGGIHQSLTTLRPGKQYFISAQIKTQDYSGTARIEVHDARGYQVYAAGSDAVTGTTGWTPILFAFTLPAGTEKVNVILRGLKDDAGSNTKGVIWFDNVKLYEANPAIPLSQTPTGPGAGMVASISAPRSGAPEWRGVGNNILQNSNFETASSRPFAWWIEDANPDTVKVSEETGVPYEGKRAMKVELPADVSANIHQDVATLESGKSYFVVGRVKVENYAGTARIAVQDARGHEVYAAVSDGITGTKHWTPVTVDFTVPDDSKKMRIILRGHKDPGGATDAGTIWFDDVKLYEAKAPAS